MTQDRLLLFDIDVHKLDWEWMQQPRHMMEACDEVSDLESDEKELQANLDQVVAKLSQAVRAAPEKYGIETSRKEGPTETAIKSVVISSQEYRKAWKRLNEVSYRLARAKNVVKALDHRKSALENLVRLHGQSYFSVPKATDQDTMMAKQRLEMERRRMERGVRT